MSVRSFPVSLLRATGALALGAIAIIAVGCPHRSPVWSPDGKQLIVLAGAAGEDVETPATLLWLVDVEAGRGERLGPPKPAVRFLGAAWVNDGEFVALTTQWADDAAVEGSGRVWRYRIDAKTWTELAVPTPSEERAPRRPPVVLRRGGEHLLAYPSGYEAVSVVSLETMKNVATFEPAELVGPGPVDASGKPGQDRGTSGLLIYRVDDTTGDSVLVALDSGLEERWARPFAKIRADIAKRLGKKSIEISFNDTSTCHLPRGKAASSAGAASDWVGVNFTVSDVGWRDGIVGYYARLGAQDGRLIDTSHAICRPGQPIAARDRVWAVAAPAKKAKSEQTSPALIGIDAKGGATQVRVPLTDLKKGQVHGYSVDRAGARIAVSINGAQPTLLIHSLDEPTKGRRIVLKE